MATVTFCASGDSVLTGAVTQPDRIRSIPKINIALYFNLLPSTSSYCEILKLPLPKVREKNSLNHDDLIDVLAIAVAYWTEQMARDHEAADKDYKASLLDKELEKFMDNAIGGGRSGGSWLGLN